MASDTVTVKVVDSIGETALATFVIPVVNPITITTASLPNATQGVPYSTPLGAFGGALPLVWSLISNATANAWACSPSGVLTCANPTAAQTDTLIFLVLDQNQVPQSVALTVQVIGSAPALVITSSSPLPLGTQGSAYSFTFAASGGVPPYTWAHTSGALDSGLSFVNGVISGTPVNAETDSLGVSVTDSASTVTPGTFALQIQASGGSGLIPRPSYNTGNGLYVAGGRVNNIDQTEFRLRGVNRNHYDSESFPGISNANANCMRVLLETTFGAPVATLFNCLQQAVTAKVVPIPVLQNFSTSGSSDGSVVMQTVAWWVTNAGTFRAFMNKYGILNIVNEFGSGSMSDAAWAATYIGPPTATTGAIQALRNAGYTCPLMVDANRSGQSTSCFPAQAANILAADPLQNIIFSYHMYAALLSTTAQVQAYAATIGAMQSQNICFVWGEFGPGNNADASGTVPPAAVIAAAEANNFGWIPWAWDDNNLAGGDSDNTWFSMTLTGPGVYTSPVPDTGGGSSQLTTFGNIVVPILQSLAVKATIF